MSIVFITAPAGTHVTEVDGVMGSITVPALTAGTIEGTGPVIGDVLTVTESNASPTAVFQWQRDGVDIVGATEATIDTSSETTGAYRRGVADGVQSMIYTPTVVVAEAAVSGATNVASHIDVVVLSTGTSLPTRTVDLSGYFAGERIIAILGSAVKSDNCTINGNTATEEMFSDAGSGRRITIYSYVLTEADIAAGNVDVVFTLNAGVRVGHIMDLYHTVSGRISTTVSQSVEGTVSISPTQTENTVIHFAAGGHDAFNGTEGLVYTAGPTERLYNVDDGNARGAAAGIIQDAPTSGVNVDWTIDGVGSYTSVLLCVENVA